MAEAAKVINLEKVLDSGPAPSLVIISPAGGSQSLSDLATVTVRLVDRGKGVGRIEWRVNGITAAVSAKPASSGPAYTITRQVALEPGDNIIEVVAYNGGNLLASLPVRTTDEMVRRHGSKGTHAQTRISGCDLKRTARRRMALSGSVAMSAVAVSPGVTADLH